MSSISGNSAGPGQPEPEQLESVAAGFALLASPLRLHLVWLLAAGESDVSALAGRVSAALPAVSQQLAKLKLGGLVHSRREGRRQVYYLDQEYAAAFVRLTAGQLTAGQLDGQLDGKHRGSAHERIG